MANTVNQVPHTFSTFKFLDNILHGRDVNPKHDLSHLQGDGATLPEVSSGGAEKVLSGWTVVKEQAKHYLSNDYPKLDYVVRGALSYFGLTYFSAAAALLNTGHAARHTFWALTGHDQNSVALAGPNLESGEALPQHEMTLSHTQLAINYTLQAVKEFAISYFTPLRYAASVVYTLAQNGARDLDLKVDDLIDKISVNETVANWLRKAGIEAGQHFRRLSANV